MGVKECFLLSIFALLIGLTLGLYYSSEKALQREGNAYVTPYFCPEDSCSTKVIQWVKKANKSIDLAIYSFTHDDIGEAIVEAHRMGVKVRVIMEERNVDKYSEYKRLVEAGIEVRLDENSALMHNKFMVIDDKVVLTGSFNYTNSADKRNDENLVVIISKQIAGEYESEFQEMWNGVYGGG